MPDQYEQVRSLSFPALATALGLDINNYRQRKHGQEWYGPCPIHNPKQNSTSFSYADDGRFNCFSCGAKGRGAIDLTKLVRNVGFQAAVEILKAGMVEESASQKKPATARPEANGGKQEFTEGLKPYTGQYHKFAVPCLWLEERIPNDNVRERYGVFCYNNPARRSAYSGKVMLPIKDQAGVLYGYLGRNIGDTPANHEDTASPPKYLFPKNLPKSKFLFGAAELVAGTFGQVPLKKVFLVESQFCVMKFAMFGLPAVACYGWSVSDEQTCILEQITRGVVFLPDRNRYTECGNVLARVARSLWLRFPPLPEGIDDPEQMTREQILAL